MKLAQRVIHACKLARTELSHLLSGLGCHESYDSSTRYAGLFVVPSLEQYAA